MSSMNFLKYKTKDSVMDIPRNCNKDAHCTYTHGIADLKQPKRRFEDSKMTSYVIVNDSVELTWYSWNDMGKIQNSQFLKIIWLVGILYSIQLYSRDNNNYYTCLDWFDTNNNLNILHVFHIPCTCIHNVYIKIYLCTL